MNGNSGMDTLIGNCGNDSIRGGQDFDILYGECGSDILSGDLGDDYAYGGTGNDFIRGGKGNDALVGESGSGKSTLIKLLLKYYDKYIGFLKSGSTRPPVELLKDIGVDLSTDEEDIKAFEFVDNIIKNLKV